MTVKGLWNNCPSWWKTDVPFMDPNNRKRTKSEDGRHSKKPTKNELLPMLTYLFGLCKVTVATCFSFTGIFYDVSVICTCPSRPGNSRSAIFLHCKMCVIRKIKLYKYKSHQTAGTSAHFLRVREKFNKLCKMMVGILACCAGCCSSLVVTCLTAR